MVWKIKAKQVLCLQARLLSGRMIARSLGVSRDSVAMVVKAAADAREVVLEVLRTLIFARPCGDDQFASCTVSPSQDMSK